MLPNVCGHLHLLYKHICYGPVSTNFFAIHCTLLENMYQINNSLYYIQYIYINILLQYHLIVLSEIFYLVTQYHNDFCVSLYQSICDSLPQPDMCANGGYISRLTQYRTADKVTILFSPPLIQF